MGSRQFDPVGIYLHNQESIFFTGRLRHFVWGIFLFLHVSPFTERVSNFAKELSGNEPGKHWAGRWVKAHEDELISRYSHVRELIPRETTI
jgi:hypothetical protein